MKQSLTLALLLVFGLIGTTAYAGPNVNTEDFAEGVISMNEAYSAKSMTKAEMRAAKKADKRALKAEKKQIRSEKRMAKFNALLNKYMSKRALGGLDDPIDKWLWFAIIGAAAAIIFTVIPGLWWLGTIFWIGSLVMLVLWIIKKYG